MIQQPILILIFNRPEKVRKLINALRSFQPPHIYIGADGPRDSEEEKLTSECRNVIDDLIDWDCSVHKLYRDQNLGLRRAVSQAITWFFSKEPMGIILEDDCIPTKAFFEFAEEMLNEYEDNLNVFHISGSSLLLGGENTYHLSKYPRVWGWASWSRAWKIYDDSEDFIGKLTPTILKRMYPRKIDRAFWRLIVEKMRLPNSNMKMRSWAYFWALNIRYNEGVCIQPYQNLIFNEGFSENATNTSKKGRLERLSIMAQPPENHKKPVKTDKSSYIDPKMDQFFVDKILIDSTINYIKVLIKMVFPFIKPRK